MMWTKKPGVPGERKGEGEGGRGRQKERTREQALNPSLITYLTAYNFGNEAFIMKMRL